MSQKRDIHTVPARGKWLQKGRVPRLLHQRIEQRLRHKNKERGPQNDQVDHVIHGRDDRIQDSDSYGKDPFSPRDKKH
jgi:hypothetical protein